MPSSNPRIRELAALLRRQVAGEVIDGGPEIERYARDASPYFRSPCLVVRPRDREDVIAVIGVAAAHGIVVIPRAGGTSLAGQCVPVGEALVLDVGANLNRVVELDVGRRRVTVQPGIVRDVLNRVLAPHGLLFAPDPSTTDRCQVGGMIGNNAWGLHAVSRGTTREHVVGLDVVLADATVAHLGAVEHANGPVSSRAASRAAALHSLVLDLVRRHRDAIDRGFPSRRGITSNAGYPLDVIRRQRPFDDDGPASNLAPLLCGAEGTLAIVTEANLELIEVPRVVRLCCLHFASVDAALQAVAPILDTAPAALELLDRAILRVAAADPQQQRNRFWLQGDPGAVLLVEHAGDDAVDVQRRSLDVSRVGEAVSFVDQADVERVWALRRAALGMLMGAEGGLRAVTGIEDAAVAPRDLPAFYRAVGELLAREGLRHFVYGPVGMGSLHIRPELPLASTDALPRYERLLDGVAGIAVGLGGTFTCKHGDGRMRGRYLAPVLGEQLVAALREVKQAFDPAGLLNPGKILDCPPFVADLLTAREE